LARDRVSVVSTEGVTLHRPVSDASDSSGEISDVQSEAARGIAGQMEGRVREQLERVVGMGNADVRIHVDLETATKERTEEHYEPSKTALRSEHKVEEGVGAEEAGVAGVPGARSNLPDAIPEGTAPPEEALAAPAAGGGPLRRSQTRNWEVDRVTQKTKMPAGSVRRVSAAVLLNGRYEQRDGAKVYVGRTKAELAALEAIVQRAIGFDETRGDDVQLQTLEFARVEEPKVADPGAPLPIYVKYWRYVAVGAGLVFLLALIVLVRRGRKKARAASAAKALAEKKAAALTSGPDPIAQLRASEAAEAAKLRALSMASEDPATAAVVLRKWLNAPGSVEARS
jgi:flagellar M-ring protein FliF